MPYSRKLLIPAITAFTVVSLLYARMPDADTKVMVLLSEYGYHPDHPKIPTYRGSSPATTFEILRASDGKVVFTGPLKQVKGDFGTFRQGDFTALTEPGKYYARVGKGVTFQDPKKPFRIAPHLWDNMQQLSA